jgi:beta-glucosidase
MKQKINFSLGVASSAFQIEGAWNTDGKGESIWDRWLHTPGHGKATGDVACDHYHLWEQDVDLLQQLEVDSYRFSVSWPRIMPDGVGRVNEKGLDFYKTLAARLKSCGISAAVTLNHWDLPQKLQDQGGWANPHTVLAFRDFAKVMFEALGPYVDLWITHNEPSVIAFMGHANGRFAPGHRDVAEALSVCHNLLIAHGAAVQAFRQSGFPGKIGITLDYFPARAASDRVEDVLAAQRDRESHLDWFAQPIFQGKYPNMMWAYYQSKGIVMPTVQPEDWQVITQPVDFLGVNYYRPSTIQAAMGENWPYDNAYVPDASEKTDPYYRHRPEALYDHLVYLQDTYAPKEIIITENGFSAYETPDRYGQIQDDARIDYLYRHLEQCVLARQSGVPVRGYYVWSFLDDLEWTGGYANRMGLVYVDRLTMRRTIKKSGWWYRQVIRDRALIDSAPQEYQEG